MPQLWKGALCGSSLDLMSFWSTWCRHPLIWGFFCKTWTSWINAQLQQYNFSDCELTSEAITFFFAVPPEHECCITQQRGLLTLLIVEPWRFLSAAARHLSSARAWFATGSTAGQEVCNYSSLQRCHSFKDGIHAFILAGPKIHSPFLASSPFHLLPLTLLPPFPPALQLV